MKSLSATPPASEDSAMQLRRHLKTNDHMIMKNLSATSPASEKSSMQLRRHLRTKDHMIMKNLSATSPASDDSPMQIRRQLRKKDPIIRKKLSAAGKQAKTTARIGEGRRPSTAQASDHPSHNAPTTAAALTRGPNTRSPRERHDTRSQHVIWTSRMVACTTTHFLKYQCV